MVIWQSFNALPFWHRKVVQILSILVMMLLAWPQSPSKPAQSAQAKSPRPTASKANASLTGPYQTKQVEVRKGDNMGLIFARLGLDSSQLANIDKLKGCDPLRMLQPGHTLTFQLSNQGQLHSLYYPHSVEQALKIERDDTGFRTSQIKRQIDTQETLSQGEIRSSFWNAAVEAGMDEQKIMDLAAIFGWDIDFAQDLQPGDRFKVVYQEKYQAGKRVATGDILAAEFINQGQTYRAIRAADGHYYSPEGRAMRKSFLRAPVNFKYISSNFNPRRLHPVTGKIRPHNGIDYVAPVGTPIMAAGAGTVVAAGFNRFNGNYVFIKHHGNFVTKYLHLAKRLVNKGERIKQGETLGTLGGTGRVTGPHLHYEFVVGGVHKNPRLLTLPQAEQLSGRALARFKQQAQPQLAKLSTDALAWQPIHSSRSELNRWQ